MVRVLLVLDDYNELLYLQTVLKKLGIDSDGVQNPRKFDEIRLGFNPDVVVLTALGKKINGISLASQVKKVNGRPKMIALQSSTQDFELSEVEDVGIDVLLDTPVNMRSFLEVIAESGGIEFSTLLEKYSKFKLQDKGGAGSAITRDDDIELSEAGDAGSSSHGSVTNLSNEASSNDNIVVSGQGNYSEEKPGISVTGSLSTEVINVKDPNLKNKSSLSHLKEKLNKSVDTEARKKHYENIVQNLEKPQDEAFLDPEVIAKYNKKMRANRDEEVESKIDSDRQTFVKALFNFAFKKNEN